MEQAGLPQVPHPPHSQSTDSYLEPNSSSHGGLNASQSASCLPKLSLPTYSGDPLSWQTFWDSFRAAVHLNPTLSGA